MASDYDLSGSRNYQGSQQDRRSGEWVGISILISILAVTLCGMICAFTYYNTVTYPAQEAWNKECAEAGGVPFPTQIRDGGATYICVKAERVGPKEAR
jgi:hypothetical protein